MKPTDQPPEFVFICYSRADMAIVDRVLAELAKEGHRMWIDRNGIVGSQTWREEIVKAMQQCRAVLFFGSRSSYDSRHVATELTLAEEAHKPIVPVLLDDTPPGGDVRYFLARLHHLKLCGADEACAIQLIHDTLLRIEDPSGFSASPLPLRPRRRGSRTLTPVLALPFVAATTWFLWNHYGNPAVKESPNKEPQQIRKGVMLPENTSEPERKPSEEALKNPDTVSIAEIDALPHGLRKVSPEAPVQEPKKLPTAKPPEPPPQMTQPGSRGLPAFPPPSDTAWLVPGTEAVVIQAIQVGTLTSEDGGILQLPVSFDIHQTVRIQKQSGERIQISSSLPSMEKGWLKKEAANQYLKSKP